MEDYINIRISVEADRIVEEIREKFHFTQMIPVLRLATAYTLKNHQDINFEKLDYEYSKDGANFHVASFDSDERLKKLIKYLFPYCERPYHYARAAAIFGLKKIKEKMDDDSEFNILDII